METTIQITSAEYKHLLKAKFDLEIVNDVLLDRASASWSGKYLVWTDGTTSEIIRHIIGHEYDKKLEELSKEDGE